MYKTETRTRPLVPTPPDPLLTIEEAAPWLRLTVSALRAQVHKGTAPRSIRIGRRRLWRQSDLQKFIDEQFEHAA